MFSKFLITGASDCPIALKYDLRIGRVVMGGHPRTIHAMESIVTDYFERKQVPRKRFLARNKVRMEFDMSNKKFYESVERLKEYGISIQEVKTHGRLMR